MLKPDIESQQEAEQIRADHTGLRQKPLNSMPVVAHIPELENDTKMDLRYQQRDRIFALGRQQLDHRAGHRN